MRTTDPTREPIFEAILAEMDGSLRELRCSSTARLVKQGVSMAHVHVLWQLEHHGPQPMHLVADLLGVSMSNATGLIDRMEERGLVERVRVPDDRRLVLVRPAPGGIRILEETEGIRRDRLRAVLSHLDETQLRRVATSFADIRSAIETELGDAGIHAHFGERPREEDPRAIPATR